MITHSALNCIRGPLQCRPTTKATYTSPRAADKPAKVSVNFALFHCSTTFKQRGSRFDSLDHWIASWRLWEVVLVALADRNIDFARMHWGTVTKHVLRKIFESTSHPPVFVRQFRTAYERNPKQIPTVVEGVRRQNPVPFHRRRMMLSIHQKIMHPNHLRTKSLMWQWSYAV